MDAYKQASVKPWMQGKTKIETLDITHGDGCKHPKGKVFILAVVREFQVWTG
ncbi:hypothetical protein ACJ8C5_27175 [Klebsiella pneumoniae]